MNDLSPPAPPLPPTALVLFAKPAIPGRCKTRLATTLAPILSPTDDPQKLAASFATAFLEDIAHTFHDHNLPFSKYLFFESQPDHPSFTPFNRANFTFMEQSRGDLGDRLKHCIYWLFEKMGHQQVIIIGSDLPHLPLHHVHQTAHILSQSPTANYSGRLLLGPTVDQGYYLIGLTSPHMHLFEAIPWSTPHVLPQTLDRAHDLNLEIDLLPTMNDIDIAKDLQSVLSTPDAHCPSTQKVAKSLTWPHTQ